MCEQKPRILIVEDDEEMARLNARFLQRNGYDALTAHTALDARSFVREHPPDLFILDIELPDGDGLSLCREFRQTSDTPVLFLTGKKESRDVVTGLDTGGDYYLTKPYDMDELLAVVKTLLRRTRQTSKKPVITRKSLTLHLWENKAYVNGRNVELTAKEYAVLLLLVQNEGRELSYETIYESVWGKGMNRDANALRLCVSRLKKKLREDETDDFSILTEYGKGYIFTTL